MREQDEENSAEHKSSRIRSKEFITKEYSYPLYGEIGAAEDYIELCNLLRDASPNDEVVIYINSGGGSVDTGNQIINAIKDSNALVRGYIESNCGSMATMIFLACHAWSVTENSEFFIHTSSGGFFGKEPEMYKHMEFMRKQTHKMVRKRYTGFLTDAEIEKVLEGTDFYFDSEEILERLEGYVAHRRSLVEEEEPKPVAKTKQKYS